MNYEIHRNGKSLGMVIPTALMAIVTCQHFIDCNYEGQPLAYTAVELPSGTPTSPGQRMRKDRVIIHREACS